MPYSIDDVTQDHINEALTYLHSPAFVEGYTDACKLDVIPTSSPPAALMAIKENFITKISTLELEQHEA